MGKGIRGAVLFLAATSLTMMVRRGVEVPRWDGESGKAVLFLSATSLTTMMRFGLVLRAWDRVPGEARPCAPWGLGSGWGAASRTHERLSLGENEARSNAPSPSPNDRSDQLQPPDGCPAAGGIKLQTAERCPAGEGLNHSNRRTVQRAKGLALRPVGPDRERGT